ncbi:hypothetical protein ENBRE01_1168 [Enteropsectra breve]|nr:hypothetical protein ENBRE01_1168 [Enteropsectra breve]
MCEGIAMECQKCRNSMWLESYAERRKDRAECPRCTYPHTFSSVLNDMVFALNEIIYQYTDITLTEYRSILNVCELELNLDLIAYYFLVMGPIKRWKGNEFCDKLVNFFKSLNSKVSLIEISDIVKYFNHDQSNAGLNDNLSLILDIHSKLTEIHANLLAQQHLKTAYEELWIKHLMYRYFKQLINLPNDYTLARRSCLQHIFRYFCERRRISVESIKSLVADLEKNNLTQERKLLEEIYFSISGKFKTIDIILVMEIFSGNPYENDQFGVLRYLKKDSILKHHPLRQLADSLSPESAIEKNHNDKDLDYYAKLVVVNTVFDMNDFGRFAFYHKYRTLFSNWHLIWKKVGFSVWEDKIKQSLERRISTALLDEIFILSSCEFVEELTKKRTLEKYDDYVNLQKVMEADLMKKELQGTSISSPSKEIRIPLAKKISKIMTKNNVKILP